MLEAYRAGRTVDKLYVQQGLQDAMISTILREARKAGTFVSFVSGEQLDRISETGRHQGVIAQTSSFAYASVEDMLAMAAGRGEDPLLVLLDGLEDPHNLGAVIRTAECAGAHGIIIPKRRSVSVNETVLKTSAGAAEHMLCARVTNIGRTIDELKNQGVWIYACDMGDTLLYDQDMTGPCAIVIGSEGFGINRLVREKCDFVISIPMKGQVNSLNASNAAAIAIYEVVKQRL